MPSDRTTIIARATPGARTQSLGEQREQQGDP
jgi:hypothetical protein